MRASALTGCPIFLDEASVTGTENAVMAAAALARGETVIANAASEPHVQDLCRFLVALGADIDGIRNERDPGSRGVERLGEAQPTGSARITSRLRAGIGLGAVAEGEIVIEDVEPEHLIAIWPSFERLGVEYAIEGHDDPGARAAGPRT